MDSEVSKAMEWALRTRAAYQFTGDEKNLREYRDAAVAFIEAHALARPSAAGDAVGCTHNAADDCDCAAYALAAAPKVSEQAGDGHMEAALAIQARKTTPQADPAPAVAVRRYLPSDEGSMQPCPDRYGPERGWVTHFDHARIVAAKDAEIADLLVEIATLERQRNTAERALLTGQATPEGSASVDEWELTADLVCCDGSGWIPYTSGQTPESFEQGEYPCPDCNAKGGQATMGARRE